MLLGAVVELADAREFLEIDEHPLPTACNACDGAILPRFCERDGRLPGEGERDVPRSWSERGGGPAGRFDKVILRFGVPGAEDC